MMHPVKISLIVLISVFLLACNGSKKNQASDNNTTETPPTTISGSVWMEINPIQCMGNPWEQMSGYLKKSESEFVKKYLSANDIEVLEVKFLKTMDYTCESCDCPRGDTMYLNVEEKEAAKLTHLGFDYSEGPGKF